MIILPGDIHASDIDVEEFYQSSSKTDDEFEVTATARLKTQLGKLSAPDILDIESFVSDLVQRQAVEVALARRVQAISTCIHCGQSDLQKWGRSKCGTQRFKCRDCSATFGATNETPFFRLRNRNLWSKYLGLMRRHVTLKDLREHHGLSLSIPTLHRWRHRFLATLTGNQPGKLAGLIEADEKFFRTSYKGSRGFKRGQPPQDRKARVRGVAGSRGTGAEQIPVLTALDRSGAISKGGSRTPNGPPSPQKWSHGWRPSP